MKKKWVVASHSVIALIIAGIFGAAIGLGYSQAFSKTPDKIADQAPGIPASPDGIVASAFTYQGVLKENGVPVTGSRTMTFRLYNAAGCSSGLLATTTPASVPVADGLFSTVVSFYYTYFNGQALWISADVGGTVIACQQATAVPYALSLRPGASISGNLDTPALSVNNDSLTGTGWGLSGTSHADGAAGVYGESYAGSYGYGVFGRNMSVSGGYAVYSDGKFGSSADSKLMLNPFSLDPDLTNETMTFTPINDGSMQLYSPSAGTFHAILPISNISYLFGTNVYFRRLHVYYHVSGGGLIDATQLIYGLGGVVYYHINDSTDRNSPSSGYYSIEVVPPRGDTSNSNYLQFTVKFTSAGYVYIEEVSIDLTESSL